MKLSKDYIPILLFTLIGLGYYFIKSNYSDATSEQDISKQKLNKLIDLIANEYVDQVDLDSIVTVTTNNILKNLDPHSLYISQTDFESVSENMKGNFVGIGVTFFTLNDTIAILNTIKNGPSQKVGIKTGDRILMANNDTLHNKKITQKQIINTLKGKINTSVELKVYRKHSNQFLNFTIKRDKVAIKSIDYSGILSSDIGYIKINRFSETTHHEFITHLTKLQQQKINSLVIDLRDNSGGYMDQSIKIADELLKEGQLIVYTKDNKKTTHKTFATDKGMFQNEKITLLINENSASASEILAGAIQDNDRGTIIGRRSFGKGLVQKDMDLGDGSIIRLTIARYYTPSGRCIQKPYNKGRIEYHNELYERFKSGELQNKDSIMTNDSLLFTTPKGKIVYGGGGIIPDLFVPTETTLPYLSSFKNFISRHVFIQLDQDRIRYQNMDIKEFISAVKKSDRIFINLQKHCASSNKLFEKSCTQPAAKKFLTAEYLRQLFGEDAYYNYLLLNDKMIKEVIQK